MTRLVVDTTALTELGSNLGRVATEFAEANVRSDAIADAVGHDALASTVRSFAHGWDDTREDMTEQIQFLADAATTIAEVILETDAELASTLETEGTTP